ncbi:MAG: ABC transporter ATP-binding protein [Acetivibrio ethanolgignens]
MVKLLKYLKKSAGYIVLIIALLFLQAYCDLALPGYTSDIINVGIQQGGIEDAVAGKLQNSTLEKLMLFMSEEEIETVKSHYTQEGDLWKLSEHLSKEEHEELNDILAMPMTIALFLSTEREETVQIRQRMQLDEEADILEVLAAMPKEQLAMLLDGMSEKMKSMPETMTSQSAIAFVKAEYEAQGIDMESLQNSYLVHTGLQMIGMALVIMLAAVSGVYLSSRVAAAFGRDVRKLIYEKVISFSSQEFDSFSTASLITRSTNDVQQVQMLMTMVFRIVLYAPIMGVGGVLKVLNTNTSMAWIIGVAVAAIMLVVMILFSVAMPRFKKLQVLIDNLNLVTREILTGLPVIRAFSTEKYEEERFEEANRRLMKTNLFVNRCMTFMMPTMLLIMNGVSVLIIYKGAYSINDGAMQVGDLMAFIQYTMQIIMSFLMITMMSIMIPRASVSGRRISEILDTEIAIRDAENTKQPVKDKAGTVEFRKVSFAYPDAEEKVLSGITFTAEQGKTTAIIGSTGSGKSTLVNLIPRFFDVCEGELLVDGVDVRQLPQKELRERIGYVPQKGVLFSGTIASNLRYGREEASNEEIRKAAKIAQALDFIEEKEDKFDSPIAQGGTNVSGGQKQRLSIARAIAKDPEIYIFDDSFSALDYKTDVVLRKALEEETHGATKIIVAQRISTILHADQIIVLDEGRIAGIGTHEELLKNCEIYEQIALSQLSEEELKGKEDE